MTMLAIRSGASRFVHVWVMGFSCLIASGCRDDPASNLAPISGVVTRDGQPLVSALVEFEPVPGRAGDPSFNPSSTGTTDEEGRFVLDTPFGLGAVVGEHTVKIWEAVRIESEEDLAPDEELALRLLPEFGEKGQSFTVSDEGTKDANFALKSAPVILPQAGRRQPVGDSPTPIRAPTRGHPGPSDRLGVQASRTLWCAITIIMWLIAMIGCFRWWKHNERRLLERS